MANDATGSASSSGSALPRLGCGCGFVPFRAGSLADPHDLSGEGGPSKRKHNRGCVDPIRASDGETRDLYVDPYARPCRAQEDPSVLSGRALCCPRARAPFGDTADGDGHRAAGRRAGVPAESGAPEDVSEPGLRQPPLPGPPSSAGRGGAGTGLGVGGARGEGTVPVPLRSEGRFCPAENSLPSGARGEQVSLQSI